MYNAAVSNLEETSFSTSQWSQFTEHGISCCLPPPLTPSLFCFSRLKSLFLVISLRMCTFIPPCVQPLIHHLLTHPLVCPPPTLLETSPTFFSHHFPPPPSFTCSSPSLPFILLHLNRPPASKSPYPWPVICHLYIPLMITSVCLLMNQSSAVDQSAQKLSDTGSYRCHPSPWQGPPPHRLLCCPWWLWHQS